MSCTISSGIARGCRDNAGGVYTVYIANYPADVVDPFDPVSGYVEKDSEDVITGYTTGTTFYEFTPNKGSSVFTETYQVSLENGTVGYEQVLTVTFSKMEAAKRNQVKLLAAGNSVIVIKDKNGKYWQMGTYDAAVLSEGNAGTGQSLTDLNGYSLTFSALEGAPAFEVTEAAISAAIV